MIIPIFIPHGGCPEKCKFCDQKVSGGTPIAKKDIIETIEKYLSTSKDNGTIEIAFYGGTFTALKQSLQLQYLDTIKPYLDNNKIHSVRIATRPDAIDIEWIQVLRDLYKLHMVELGVQSFEENVLKMAGRSHLNTQLIEATNILKNLNIKVGYHLMIGLPGETDQSDQLTVEWLAKLKPNTVRIHPLVVIENTEFSKEFSEKKWIPISLNESIDRTAFLVEECEKLNIKVIRLGLQSNEILSAHSMEGSYHPAFGELVRGRILARKLKKAKKNINWEAHVNQNEKNLLNAHDGYNLNWMQS